MNDFLVVLILYEVQLQNSSAFDSITRAMKDLKGSLFIYDNSFQPQVCGSSQWDITYIHDPSNSGVSKAYNIGFQRAKELNKKWMLLTDQDTIFPDDFFDRLWKTVAEKPAGELFMPRVKSKSTFISPYRFKWGRGFSSSILKHGIYSADKFKFINSGLLISTDLFQKCNGYDERFPLDFSDLAFIERVFQHQRYFFVIKATCIQQLSSDDQNLNRVLVRYGFYLEGSKLFGKEYHSGFYLFVNRIFRSIKLSLRFRTTKFMKHLIHS
jgi:GT2 family glycosyltransferase